MAGHLAETEIAVALSQCKSTTSKFSVCFEENINLISASLPGSESRTSKVQLYVHFYVPLSFCWFWQNTLLHKQEISLERNLINSWYAFVDLFLTSSNVCKGKKCLNAESLKCFSLKCYMFGYVSKYMEIVISFVYSWYL
jgi:hypothetical protein